MFLTVRKVHVTRARDLSRTQILVSQIRRVIHEVRDMNKYIGNNKKQQSNNLSKQEDLPHMRDPSPHNDERNGGDYKYSANSMYEPQSQDEHGKLSEPLYSLAPNVL